MKTIDVSIIIACKNEGTNVKMTVDSILDAVCDIGYEIIVIDDASIDGCCSFLNGDSKYKDVIWNRTIGVGVMGARNLGAESAKGRVLYFLDSHVKVHDYWLDKLINTMDQYRVDLVTSALSSINDPRWVGYGITWNEEIRPIWIRENKGTVEVPVTGTASLGITKTAFDRIYGFDRIFKGWGKEDEEICLKARLYGYQLLVNPNVVVEHLFKDAHPYPINYDNLHFNWVCMANNHFNYDRLSKVYDLMKRTHNYTDGVKRLIDLNMPLMNKQRDKYFRERAYDDDYFFNKFNINF